MIYLTVLNRWIFSGSLRHFLTNFRHFNDPQKPCGHCTDEFMFTSMWLKIWFHTFFLFFHNPRFSVSNLNYFSLTFSFALLCPWPSSWRLSWYNLCSLWSFSLCCCSHSFLSSRSSCCSSYCRLCSTSWRICCAMYRCCSRTCVSTQNTHSVCIYHAELCTWHSDSRLQWWPT